MDNLHDDDIILFNTVATAMRTVAKKYGLRLHRITPLPMPKSGMADRMGDCSYTGEIRIVMRCTVDGVWCDEPLSPDEIWNTAGHELAHLRHMDHGPDFLLFQAELNEALSHRKGDHRSRMIDKIVKLQQRRQGEAEIGNLEAAEMFASAINKMLIAYELSPSDLDYARAAADDPVIEVELNLNAYQIELKKSRIAWQETLARVVAGANLCTFLINTNSNRIWFVGTKSHAIAAEYTYGMLVPAAIKMCITEYFRFYSKCRFVDRDLTKTHGFKASWLNAFVERIRERLNEARTAAMQEATPDIPGGERTALIRLEGSLIKAKKYIEDKFAGKKAAPVLKNALSKNKDGRRMGREAADRIPLHRKVMTASNKKPVGLLK